MKNTSQNPFIAKLESKSNEELELIIKKRKQNFEDAVLGATYILKERGVRVKTPIEKEIGIEKQSEREEKEQTETVAADQKKESNH